MCATYVGLCMYADMWLCSWASCIPWKVCFASQLNGDSIDEQRNKKPCATVLGGGRAVHVHFDQSEKKMLKC